MKNLVVFASGSGTNFQAIIDAVESGVFSARIKGLIVNKNSIQAIDRAKKHNIPVEIIRRKDFNTKEDYIACLRSTLHRWSPDLIVLAGYLRKIPDSIISIFHNQIINIHPSLLPKYGGKGYYGIHVHEAVLANEEKESGCTVHVVSEEYDQGHILGQTKVPVKPGDTPKILQRRILEKEHQLLIQVIKEILTKKES
ncbi:MAG TPA: phosphoribosylglycinamide formyltransferase [Balneolales bacterium]|nr:phosphoribosylglycinamide formyltransferase [Balneolales bacterium]